MEHQKIESIDLEPRYSTNEMPGRCVKCLAEEKLFSCMRELLIGEKDSNEIQNQYELLHTFLESEDLQKLCDETEKYLAEGRQVNVRITLEAGKPRYEIDLK